MTSPLCTCHVTDLDVLVVDHVTDELRVTLDGQSLVLVRREIPAKQ